MNILHLTTYLQGGAGQVVVDLVKDTLKGEGVVEVVVSKTEYPGYGNYAGHLEQLENINGPVHLIDSLFKRDEQLNEKVIEFVVGRLKQKKLDLIHAHAAIPAMIAKKAIRRAGLGIPVVQSMQGWGTNKTPEEEQQDITILNALNRVVAVSKSSKELLIQKGVRPELINVIPNGVGEFENGSISEIDLSVVESLKTEGRVLIGCVGTICERKNQLALLKAFELLNKQQQNGKQFSLLLIGEDELNGTCQKHATDAGIEKFVKVLGYRANARAFLSHFDVFCLPTFAEGSPLSIAECFCDGTLVVGSAIPEIREMIVDGENGFLCDASDPKSISEVLLRGLFVDDMQKALMLEKAYEVYQRSYSQEAMLRSYFELYKVC